MISVKMTKTETLRKQANKTKATIKASSGRSDQTRVKRKPILNTKKTKQQKEKKITKRIRKCSKDQPLPPTHTGSAKPIQKNIVKKTKPRVKTMKKKSIIKTKRKIATNKKPKNNQKMSSKRRAYQNPRIDI